MRTPGLLPGGREADPQHVSIVWPNVDPAVRQDIPWPPPVPERFVRYFNETSIGTGEKIFVPYNGGDKPPSQKGTCSVHAKPHASEGRVNAGLGSRRAPPSPGYCPLHMGRLAQAGSCSNSAKQDEKLSAARRST